MSNFIGCARCDTKMEDVRVFQPTGGLAFRTYGHYGSAYFDPMDGSWVEIAICDRCMPLVQKHNGRSDPEAVAIPLTDVSLTRDDDWVEIPGVIDTN